MHPISTLSAAEHAALYERARAEARRLRREAIAGAFAAAANAVRAAWRQKAAPRTAAPRGRVAEA
jgi:hypothetical protein